jgi:hypothetical protein
MQIESWHGESRRIECALNFDQGDVTMLVRLVQRDDRAVPGKLQIGLSGAN